eukprot:TRINITY_DN9854_c0_g1_i1.p3 TRINITY_DN9854_c0_g1~~TRINITY_DN9854_c0_g1_i1.p3  ORF type:complete len:133 (+),score=21.70 TRINITY_DN9854_c0_g1_i1:898-1296(+)
MASKAKKKATKFSDDAPWRLPSSGVPAISGKAVLVVRENPGSKYAMSILKHPDPVGLGLARDATVEAAGADCIIPGLSRPVRILGLQVWPVSVKPPPILSGKALAPIGREMKTILTVMDKAFDLMQASFGSR